MRTITLSNLLVLIEQTKEQIRELSRLVRRASIITRDVELNGNITEINEVLNFEKIFADFNNEMKKLVLYKDLLMTNNATVETSFGITITQTMNEIIRLKELKNVLDDIYTTRSTKTRFSDGNGISAYYKESVYNYDREKIEDTRRDTDARIADLEASLANINATYNVIIP